MTFTLRPLQEVDIEPVLDLSIAAWEPVFQSFERILGRDLFLMEYPDWPKNQRDAVDGVLRDTEKFTTYIADVDGAVAGFISYTVDADAKTGEVYMVAVSPQFQKRGIGLALNELALEKMREQGVRIAVVGTGGDPGHAPARRTYEKAGYTALPLVRYYKDLTEEK